jgi:glycosyltransferase involved in cell wall biosynthesis
MDLSVIVTTYDQPRWLEHVLTGYGEQSYPYFEVVVADDGSGPETREVVDRARRNLAPPLVHVWHEDQGFRKTVILNRAIQAAGGDYLLFTDGDCIPRSDLVEVHARHARKRRFLSGGYLKLPAAVSDQVTGDGIRSGAVFDSSWLRSGGWRSGRRALRLSRSTALAGFLDAITPTGPTWNGHNSSAWRDDIVEANGFDLDMGYGEEDRALGERLENLGVRGMQIRHRAPCIHLPHAQPYRDPAVVVENKRIRKRIREKGEIRARLGLAELPQDPLLSLRGSGEEPMDAMKEEKG